ncbi:MAG TPA: ABC transporter substrate-binding protein [Acidimicrobiales bacterium]|jgi:iron complex transport system substrate-binding protein|nr:ABC transporter substrate-binding protein [Acidimicrobiales bacterium]
MFKHRQSKLLYPAVLSLLLVALGCGKASSGTTTTGHPPATVAAAGTFPVTVRAANGSVRIAARPTSIVCLSPTATEMLYAIGAGPQVKAVDKYSDYPKGVPTTNLDGLDPNVESIAAYDPDLVIVSNDTSSLNSQLKALGIPVVYEPAAADLAQEYAEFVSLGQATGHVSQATAEVAKLKGQIAAIVGGVAKPARPATYYYELDQTYYSETSSTFIGQVLGLLGLRSIADTAKGAASSGGYPQLSAEFILKANPDYVFLADTVCCQQSPATVAARPGWSVLSAVKDHRVLGLNDDIASRWGPRIVVLIGEVADFIKAHPVAGS